MMHILKLFNLFLSITAKLEPAMLFVVRLGAAYIFMSSGLVKIQDMESTILLFEYEYQVPVLSPVLAAYAATFMELAMPVLLIIGLGARASAVPLLVMTAVIQTIYPNLQHAWWAIILGVVLFVGPGKWSIDHHIAKKHASKTAA